MSKVSLFGGGGDGARAGDACELVGWLLLAGVGPPFGVLVVVGVCVGVCVGGRWGMEEAVGAEGRSCWKLGCKVFDEEDGRVGFVDALRAKAGLCRCCCC